jgi:hypothetical protein
MKRIRIAPNLIAILAAATATCSGCGHDDNGIDDYHA